MNIGIIGKMCSGKSTVANKIKENNENYNITSFAKKVKEIAVDLFDMNVKDRKLLQSIGTKMREIDKDIWVKYTLKHCSNFKYNIIDDVRYENEIKYLKNNGWFLIKLEICPDKQIERLKTTYPNTWKDHYKNMNHESENLINISEDIYDLKIDSTQDINIIYEKIIKYLI